MDITEFLQQSAGKWFSQRTSHHLAAQQSESSKSDILVEILDTDSPEVMKLCQVYSADPELALCGVRVTWSQEKQTGSTLLVPVVNPDKTNEGKLLYNPGAAEPPVAGRYVMGNDEALTLITERDTLYSEERLWFASPNLRFRTIVVKQPGGFGLASFCSEIRMGLSQPQPQVTSATKGVSQSS